MQRAARHLLPDDKALAGCLSWLQFGQDAVELWAIPGCGTARFGNVQTCSSVWRCPVCASKITERRRLQELKPALAEAKERGWHCVMVTYTLRHLILDMLDPLLDGLAKARRMARSGKRWAKMREKYGIVGSIRALEITHGRNGWHPHYHELMFFEGKIDRDELLNDLRRQWGDGLRLARLRDVNSHSVKISDSFRNIEDYVSKWGHDPKWGLAEEVSKQPVKSARAEKGHSPMQLLRSFAETGDVEHGALFTEYARAMKGQRQLVWSPGFKTLLGVAELSDAEIEQQATENPEVFMGRVEEPVWRCLLADDMRARLWSTVATGDNDAVAALLTPYRTTEKRDYLTFGLMYVGDQSALDERDKWPVVNEAARRSAWIDPAILAGDVSGPGSADTVARLRAREEAGEDIPVFTRRREAKRKIGQEVRALLPWVVLSHGRHAWDIAPNPNYDAGGPLAPKQLCLSEQSD